MRLTEQQVETILSIVSGIAGKDARVILFGSRLKDGARGGDLDLLVESDELPDLMQRSRIKYALESSLSIPVDIEVRKKSDLPTPFQRIALATGVLLGE